MGRQVGSSGRVRSTAIALLAGAAVAIAVPSAGLALGGLDDEGVSLAARGSFASFTPASVDARLAKIVSENGTSAARLMRFTPAGAANRPTRSVTVAIRVDDETARAIQVRTALAAGRAQPGLNGVAIAPTRYDLGIARGYRSFAQPLTLPSEIRRIDMPDLAEFEPSGSASKSKPGRFNARIALEDRANAGRAPRTLESLSQQSVDVGGSYRVARNLDVTAGVRYSQERDRLAPLTDDGTQDSQAVYVGTQFRF